MIEFVTNHGARYRVVEHYGGIGVVVDEGYGIKRTLLSIQGGGFEILYGGHWIAGKLRVKAGRRVVPKVIELHSWYLFNHAQDAMACHSPFIWQGRSMEVTACYWNGRGSYSVALIPWKDKANG